MDYLDFYKLKQEPFSNAPVGRFYFDSAQHNQALIRMQYALRSMKGLAIIVGGVGAGKTTLARKLLDALDEREYEATLLVIIHSAITPDWLLNRIAVQLGVQEPATDKLTLLGQLYQRLLAIHASGRKAVVLVDEAQMLQTRELMEEFRGLLNLEVPERKLLSFVFFGLPDVEVNLQFDPPLAQRVALRIRIDPLDRETSREYIHHRLEVAGAARVPFTEEAIDLLHRASGGVPRVINTLCDNALFEGAMAGRETIDAAMVRAVAQNLSFSTAERAGPPPVMHTFAPMPSSSRPSMPPLPVLPSLPPLSALTMSAIRIAKTEAIPDAATRDALEEIDRVLAQISGIGPAS